MAANLNHAYPAPPYPIMVLLIPFERGMRSADGRNRKRCPIFCIRMHETSGLLLMDVLITCTLHYQSMLSHANSWLMRPTKKEQSYRTERHSPERSERLPLELVRGRTGAVQLCLEDKAVHRRRELSSKELPRSRRRRRICNSVRASESSFTM